VDPERVRTEISAHLEAAQTARGDGRDAERVAHLARAQEAARALGDAVLLQTASWRLAKAHHDRGDTPAVLDAVAVLLDATSERTGGWLRVREAVGPFDHHPQGLRAWPALARRHGDRVGYAHPALRALWDAWIAKQVATGEPVLAAWGQIERAWIDAVQARVDDVAALARAIDRTAPARLAGGTHLHPRATAPDESLGWLRIDAARTWVWAAVWADAPAREVGEARELLLDAWSELHAGVPDDVWVLDALVAAESRVRVPGGHDHRASLRAAVDRADLDPGHALRIRALLLAADEPAAAVRDALAAADRCVAAGLGPEWSAWALALAARLDPSSGAGARLHATNTTWSLGVRAGSTEPTGSPR
jgi:hypothetical protein